MPSKIKSLLIFFVCLVALPLFAQEAPPEKAKPKVVTPPWVEIQYRMEFLAGKIGVLDASIKKMLEEKRKMPVDAPQMKAFVQQLVYSHKELENLVAEHDKLNTQLKFRYPERSSKEEQHVSYDLKPLEEMEAEMGIDSRLKKVLGQMHRQYGYDPETLAKAKLAEQKKRQPASVKSKAVAVEPEKKSVDRMTIDEMPPIVLQK